MRYTNRHGINEPLATALRFEDKKFDPKRLSVTKLISHPHMVVLQERHDDEIVTDISGNLWMYLGRMAHKVAEDVASEDDLTEEKLTLPVVGIDVTVVGIPDQYRDETITDYKLTGTYSFIMGLRPDWVQQLNLYALLLREAGFTVNHLKITMILRDWNQTKSETSSGYPVCPIQTVIVPLWGHQEQMDFLCAKVNDIIKYRDADDNTYDPCTQEDRWERGETFAVIKKGNKRAKRVFKVSDSSGGAPVARANAEVYVRTCGEGFIVEHRQGEPIRCQRNICGVRDWCSFWKNREEA